ncbi:MAG: twin-arginine translocation signal domain-containing protein [Chloroflexi bacterium]|nr:twin-arginine translocation signal domain-containing protein [Chloroflexota bacterium]
MTDKLTRRDFLKLAGTGAAATAILTGCGPASRYVVREPYTQMPEYTYNGQSAHYATTCRECPAGCGIVVRTHQGRAIKVEGNKLHPVNLGRTCARGQASLQGLYNPDRVQGPVRQNGRASGAFTPLSWEEAVTVVRDALTDEGPGEIAFLLGLAPDHLADLVTGVAAALGAPAPIRYGAYSMFEARNTLAEATGRMFGERRLPVFDLANAAVTVSFGANFLETWLSPVAYTRAYARMRRGAAGERGRLVQFEARQSQTAAKADEWIPCVPGTEGSLALAIGRLIAESRGGAMPKAFQGVDAVANAAAAGVDDETLGRMASLLAGADRPLVIPGGAALGQSNGLETAEAILALNVLLGNLGRPGGVFLTPDLPVHAAHNRLSGTLVDLAGLVEKMKTGQVKSIFVHGVNPLFEIPAALDFAAALAHVPLVVSFASFPDETSAESDFILPDHASLESWGYQFAAPAADRPALSASQPVVIPFYDTKATADVLLAAIQSAGGSLAAAVPYQDEVAFIRESVLALVTESGYFNAPEINTFWAQWQQYGGWWKAGSGLGAPLAASALDRSLQVPPAEFEGQGEFLFLVYPSALMGDGTGANKPWLQETPDPMTTVMWNSWVEINPLTADHLGLKDDDLVRLVSPYGELAAVVYRYPAIQPGVVAMPFGQGHSTYGRYAAGRGANPAALLPLKNNGAGDLAFGAVRVDILKTGKSQPLARNESRLGVYGEE